jgi:hypothetical protein
MPMQVFCLSGLTQMLAKTGNPAKLSLSKGKHTLKIEPQRKKPGIIRRFRV